MTASISALSLPPEKSRIGAPDWSRDGRDWPNRENSHFISANGLREGWYMSRIPPDLRTKDPLLAASHELNDEFQTLDTQVQRFVATVRGRR